MKKIEGLEILRFVEYGKDFYCIEVKNFKSLSVDTPKDLEKVRSILQVKQKA